MKKINSVIMLVVVGFVLSPEAFSAIDNAGVMDNVSDRFKTHASSWASIIETVATRLFWTLVTISMVWTFGMMALRKADLAEFFAELVRFIIFTGFFFWLLDNGPKIAMAIIESLMEIGGDASAVDGYARSFSASGIVDIGFILFGKTLVEVSRFSPIDSLIGILLGLGILVLTALVGINMMLLLISAWILAYAGIFFLGFGGARWTSDMAVSYYKTVLGIAIQIMTMILLIGIGVSLINEYYTKMETDINISEMAVVLIVTLIIFVLSNKIPPLVAGIITGASVGGQGMGQFGAGAAVGAAMAAASTAGAAISAGASNVAGGVQAVMAAVSQASQNVASGNDIMSNLGGNNESSGGGGSSESSGGGAGTGDTPFAEAAGYGGGGSPSSGSGESSGGASGNENESAGGGGGNSDSSGDSGSSSSGSGESSGGASGNEESGSAESSGGGGSDDSSESSGDSAESRGNDSRASESSFLGAAARAGRVAADAGVMLARGAVDVARQGVGDMQEGAQDRVAQSTMGKIAASIRGGAGKPLSDAAKAEVAAFVNGGKKP